jgi:MFS family permease
MTTEKRPTGMFGFTLVWLGQIVSILATNMSAFALTIWVFEKTGSATALALMQVFFITPFLIISPIAGVMVDRHNRKMMMMISDLLAGVATIAILILQFMGVLEVWHLYVAAMAGIFGSDFDHDSQGAVWTGERHDVVDGNGARCVRSNAGGCLIAHSGPDRDLID